MGAAAGTTLALALLACGCVFAALAGPALSLHTRSEALDQELNGLGGTTKAVQVSAALTEFMGPLTESGSGAEQNLSLSQLTDSRGNSAAVSRRSGCRSRRATGPA